MFEKIALIWSKYGYIYLQGTWGTIYLALLTVLLGTVLGTLLAIMKLSKVKPLEWIVGVYVWIIRGTPILLQIYFFYFFVPDILPFEINEEQCIIMALVVNASAYVAEIIRAGIQAVDKGQTEAARSLGMSAYHTMSRVILPQAIKNILPALGRTVCDLYYHSGPYDFRYFVSGIDNGTVIFDEADRREAQGQ